MVELEAEPRPPVPTHGSSCFKGMVGPALPDAGDLGAGKGVALLARVPLLSLTWSLWGRSGRGRHLLPVFSHRLPQGLWFGKVSGAGLPPQMEEVDPGSELQEGQGLPALHTILPPKGAWLQDTGRFQKVSEGMSK